MKRGDDGRMVGFSFAPMLCLIPFSCAREAREGARGGGLTITITCRQWAQVGCKPTTTSGFSTCAPRNVRRGVDG